MTLQQTFKPKVAAKEYPVLDTKPLSSVVSSSCARPGKFDLISLKEQDLVGLEDNPEFWNMKIDSGDTTDSSPKTNKGFTPTDSQMEGLRSIHERTQVSQNLKLFEGGRLLPQPKRKRQIDSRFDIQFTDLKNPELDNASDSEIGYNSDDLPEAVLPTVGQEDIIPKPVLSSLSRMANVDHGHPAKRLKTLSAVSSHFLYIDTT